MAATSREDAESNARLLKALMEDGEDGSLVDKVWSSINEEENSMVKDPTVASHLQLDLDDDGKPLQLRFLYVDELDCIGCTYCASIARNSFVMEPDAGRARAFAQGADDPEIVLEAIDSCPVNCISFVDHADLVILENERDGVTIDQRSSGYRHGDQSRNNLMHETKAKLGTGMMCCNNCPSRGCKACPTYPNPSPNPNPSPDPNPISNPNQECPMYGVGLNPVYIARQEELQAKREASGAAQQERESAEREDLVGAIFADAASAAEDLDLLDAFDPLEACVTEAASAAELVECAEAAGAGETAAAAAAAAAAAGEAEAEDCIAESATAGELVDCAGGGAPPAETEEERKERKISRALKSLFGAPAELEDEWP